MTVTPAAEASAWRAALDKVIAAPGTIVDRFDLLEETTSTQDECRRRTENRAGLLVTALRQTAGRGRLGRPWADDRGEGLAMTLSIAAQSPERLSIACAVAVCETAEFFIQRPLGIRWPNDVMADGRKLAGILIEQHRDIALIGIGMNVNQMAWAGDLTDVAISLRQLTGDGLNRSRVLVLSVERLRINLARPDDSLAGEFGKRDLLCGATQTFLLGAERITGVVERIDPLKGLAVRTADGPRFLPAAQTSLVKGGPGGRGRD